MARNILILELVWLIAGDQLLMAGHNVTLVAATRPPNSSTATAPKFASNCRTKRRTGRLLAQSAGEADATTPANVDLSRYDLVGLAMQEPQYANHTIRVLMIKIAAADLPCLSIMNMPPLALSQANPGAGGNDLDEAYTNAQVWERFKPGLVSLCSPDPQAFRPPEEAANVLHVGLPTNFKAAAFADEKHNQLLRELEADIDAVKLDGLDVPVKLKVFDSLFVPLGEMVDAADRELSLVSRCTSRNRSATPYTAI